MLLLLYTPIQARCTETRVTAHSLFGPVSSLQAADAKSVLGMRSPLVFHWIPCGKRTRALVLIQRIVVFMWLESGLGLGDATHTCYLSSTEHSSAPNPHIH